MNVEKKSQTTMERLLEETKKLVPKPVEADNHGYLHGLTVLAWLRAAEEKGWIKQEDMKGQITLKVHTVRKDIERGDLPENALDRIGIAGKLIDLLGYEEEPKEWRE